MAGERVDNPLDHPLVAPHVNTAAKTFELAVAFLASRASDYPTGATIAVGGGLLAAW